MSYQMAFTEDLDCFVFVRLPRSEYSFAIPLDDFDGIVHLLTPKCPSCASNLNSWFQPNFSITRIIMMSPTDMDAGARFMQYVVAMKVKDKFFFRENLRTHIILCNVRLTYTPTILFRYHS